MRVLLQRTSSSSVSINGVINGQIGSGLTVLVGFKETDTEETIEKMINKIINLRIFEDDNGKMNKSLLDVNGSILSISQFTLYANCCEGRRPSFTEACPPLRAKELYITFNRKIKERNIHIEEGIFGADMVVNLTNIGPCTIYLDSEILGF